MSVTQPSNISANAGDPSALKDPNSPESLALRAKRLEVQTAADTQYDPPPPAKEGYQNEVQIQWNQATLDRHETALSLFLAMSGILLIYALVPDQ